MSRLCKTPSCTKGIDENGREFVRQLPLRLGFYPQPNTSDGWLMAWLCDECGYDSSLEAFASRPEFSYTAYRERRGSF